MIVSHRSSVSGQDASLSLDLLLFSNTDIECFLIRVDRVDQLAALFLKVLLVHGQQTLEEKVPVYKSCFGFHFKSLGVLFCIKECIVWTTDRIVFVSFT